MIRDQVNLENCGMGSNVGHMEGVVSDSSYNPNTGGCGARAGLNEMWTL